MIPSEQRIQDKIERFERMRNRTFESLDSDRVPEKNIPKAHRTIGRNSQAIGLYRLSLGDCNTSIDEFTISVEWYCTALHELRYRRDSAWESETNNVLDLLYSALLTGDDERHQNAAKMALDVPEEFVDRFPPTYRYYYLKALAASILDTGVQHEYLDSLEETLADLDSTKHTFFEALWIALSGIEERDEDKFDTGVKQLLDWHHKQVDFENKTSANDLVCRQAATLMVLARQKGLDVHVDSEFIPDCVYELA